MLLCKQVSSFAVPSGSLVASGLIRTPPLMGLSSVPLITPIVVPPSATIASLSTITGSSEYTIGAAVVVVVVVVVVVTCSLNWDLRKRSKSKGVSDEFPKLTAKF